MQLIIRTERVEYGIHPLNTDFVPCVIRVLDAAQEDCFYWRTQAHAELDLLILRGSKRIGFEFKHADVPTTTKSMHIAIQDLGLRHLFVVYPGSSSFPLTSKITALGIQDLVELPAKLEKLDLSGD